MPPRRAARIGALIAAALALHGVVLGGADWVWPSTAPPPLPAAPLEVRVLEPAPAAVTSVTSNLPTPPATPVMPAAAPAPSLRPVPRTPGAARSVAAAPPAQLAEPPTALPLIERVQAAPLAAASASVDEDAIPLYRTQLPPPATLRYELSHGALRGTGEWVWRPQGQHYELTLEFRLSGLVILSQSSTGELDAAGIAPLRFTDQRPRRGTTAANFQRGLGTITYSGASSVFALKAGAQDRLSWMLQLAAIVSAEPQLAAPGARVVMQVTGARGDAGVWVFRCLGTEAVDMRGGTIEARKFVREPREAYDTAVQVWLDPKQHHLPVRATQQSGPNDAGYELRLLEMRTPN